MKVAVCDENMDSVNLILSLIEQYRKKYQISVRIFESGEELLKYHDTFDIIYIGIEMKGISGIEVATSIRKQKDDVIIIFITSYTNYILDAFRLGAFQYLTKPFTNEDFELDFERAINTFLTRHMRISVKWRDEISVLECHNIIYIEAYNRHLFIETLDNKYKCVGKLSDKYEELKMFGFRRCHQGYLVNISKIKRIEKNKLIMENSIEIPISRKFKTEITDTFKLYMEGEIF